MRIFTLFRFPIKDNIEAATKRAARGANEVKAYERLTQVCAGQAMPAKIALLI
jgi:hypothetical protein